MVECPDCGKYWEKSSLNNSNMCKPCRRIYDFKWRQKRKSLGLTYSGSDTWDKNKQLAYIERNRFKMNARAAARRAIKSGKLIPRPCICGKRKVEAHHPDYSKPLEVKWFCRSCHHKEHIFLRQAEAEVKK